ncbi:MAG: cystathionine beta-lyase, partial [Bacteroidales bacterium]|nr:cystathionine beta-lyase [Bacteroidales bacterium]
MKYNFDEVIPRQNTGSLKYDINLQIFGSDDLLPMWVADMDFKTPDFVVNALKKRLEHPILGYFYHTDGFYQSIVNWMWKRHQWKIEKEWITFAPGIVS